VARTPAAQRAYIQQFARTPYAVNFTRNNSTRFTLVTLHTLYGANPADRVPELTAIARWLHRWSAGRDREARTYRPPQRPALPSLHLHRLATPAGLNHIPRTIFDDPYAPRQ
jgi:hypothetical protein